MARNDPSAKEIADLERQQREAELQAEFDEFDRKEKERAAREAAYDRERSQVELSYAKQNQTKTYTGIKTIDKYLDRADIAAETHASAKRIGAEKEIRNLEKQGKITPEYAKYLREEVSGKYEKQKKSTARYAVETASSFVSGAASYMDNGPRRKSASPLRRSYRTNIRREGSLSSGICMGPEPTRMGAHFPSFSAPSFGAPSPTKAPTKKIGELNMDFPKFGGAKIPKNGGGIFTNLTSPFGARKENPLKDKRKRKGLW